MRKPYPTDLSDAEWNYIEPHLPAPKGHGRPRTHNLREILDAVFFYVLKSGCQWRLLPHDFPRWPTVYHYFRQWRIDGTWERINQAVRERLRVRLRRDPQPSAGVVDSQGRSRLPRLAQKTEVTTKGAGRERAASGIYWWTHTHTEGFVLKAKVMSAKVMDLEKGSRCYCSKRTSNSPVSLTCGWTPATVAKTRASTGCGKPWGGAWRARGAPTKARPRRGVDDLG
jgi:putative transposase